MAANITHTDRVVRQKGHALLCKCHPDFSNLGYLLPNDEIESDRLDMHHEMILTAMHRKLHLAPISKDLQRVIDLGTGTGT